MDANDAVVQGILSEATRLITEAPDERRWDCMHALFAFCVGGFCAEYERDELIEMLDSAREQALAARTALLTAAN